MASAGARAYNGGLGAEPLVRGSGGHSPRLKLHGNQQEIGVNEGNEKGQGIKIPGIARIHP